MIRSFLSVFGVLAVLAPAVWAQPMQVVATTPAEGAVGVAGAARVTFRFSRALPAFGTEFTYGFFWSPVDSTRLGRYGQDPEETRDLTKVFFDLEHRPGTDYAFLVYGVAASDGRRMERPFVLNYSTAATAGGRRVQGHVAPGERAVLPASVRATRLAHLARQALAHTATGGSLPPASKNATASRTIALDAATSAVWTAADVDPARTVVLLLDAYALDRDVWHIRAAAVPDAGGSFTLERVRPGVYWPLAVNYADDTGRSFGAFGFFDANGDLAPDSLVVDADDVTSLGLSLYAQRAATAASQLPLATTLAARTRPAAQPVMVAAVMGPAYGQVFDDGTAYTWRYTFFSPPDSVYTTVTLDPVNAYVEESPGEPPMATIPLSFVDSDRATAVAEAAVGASFRARFAPATVPVALEGGDLPYAFRPYGEAPYWRVTYFAPPGMPYETATVLVDMASGVVQEGSYVATEDIGGAAGFALDAVRPDPAQGPVTATLRTSGAGAVRLSVYDLLGRRVAVVLDATLSAGRHEVRWDASALATGTYFLRAEEQGRAATRLFTVAR